MYLLVSVLVTDGIWRSLKEKRFIIYSKRVHFFSTHLVCALTTRRTLIIMVSMSEVFPDLFKASHRV